MSLIKKILLCPSEKINRTTPVNLQKKDNALFAHEYTCQIDETYLYKYEHVNVSGQGLAVHKCTRYFFLCTVPQCINHSLVNKYLYAKMQVQNIVFRTEYIVPKAIFISDDNSHGYFHWITDVLPKLFLVEKSIFNDYILLIPEKFFSMIANETIKQYKIQSQQILVIPRYKKVLVDELLVLEHSALPTGTGNYRPKIIQKIRSYYTEIFSKNENDLQTEENKKLFDGKHPCNTHSQLTKVGNSVLLRYGRRLFISRSDAKYRYLANEIDIIPMLEKNGYSILKAAELSFKEQVVLFSNAQIIIGMHGAGLTNMIWMPKDSKIAEIRLEGDSHNNCYFSLASALNLKYYYSLASICPMKNSSRGFNSVLKDNFIWDKNSVEKLLRQLDE